MEVAKNWLLGAAVIAMIVLGAKVSQQAQVIDHLQSAVTTAPPTAVAAADTGPGALLSRAAEAPTRAEPDAVRRLARTPVTP